MRRIRFRGPAWARFAAVAAFELAVLFLFLREIGALEALLPKVSALATPPEPSTTIAILLAALLVLPAVAGRLPSVVSSLQLPLPGGQAVIELREMRAEIDQHKKRIERVSNELQLAIDAIVAHQLASANGNAGGADGAREGAGRPQTSSPEQRSLPPEIRTETEIAIGCSRFTEQRLLCAIVKVLLERRGFEGKVTPRYDYGGPALNFVSLLNRQIDVYPVYTWTGFELSLGPAIRSFHRELQSQPARRAIRILRNVYKHANLEWGEYLGFQDSWTLVMRRDTAERFGIEKISDLTRRPGRFRLGCDREFFGRSEGYGLLVSPEQAGGYGIRFRGTEFYRHRDVYDALLSGGVDVIDGFTTDPQIEDREFFELADDLSLFGSYYAVPVFHGTLREKCPGAAEALESLDGVISEEAMRDMIDKADRADDDHFDRVEEIAERFLRRKGLLT